MTTNATGAVAPLPTKVKLLVRGIYAVGIASTSYGLFDLFATRAGFATLPSATLAAFIETFALVAATYSTRARLRGESGFATRSVVALGTLGSSALQMGFHWTDNKLLAFALPLASVLTLVAWLLDVADRHSVVFMAQRAQRRARTAQRRMVGAEILAYAVASGPRRALREWKERTRSVGHARREATARDLLASYGAVATPVHAVAPTQPVADAAPVIEHVAPKPTATPVTARRELATPTQRTASSSKRVKPTIVGDDEVANDLRALDGLATDCARHMWRRYGADASPQMIVNTLAKYGVAISRPSVSVLRAEVFA